ncbi:CsbD family protein [Streptomyces sp. NPDC059740]|uniref:CsbD family protein n=1 Tax=Streptomyces sp. NPDC059740 TaxID=3346926 RepID=UPI00365C88A0
MTAKRKAQAKGAQVQGAMKETAGRMTGNHRMQAEGRAEKAAGKALDAEEKSRSRMRGH